MRIHPNKLVIDVQQEFSRMFPFLKLEFYRSTGSRRVDPVKQNMLAFDRKIGEGQINITDGEIDIKPAMTVKELEKRLKDEFSLVAQVFRRSRNVWLQTTMTDSWTLSNQNEHGKEISLGKVKSIVPGDFDLERDTGN